MYSSYRVFKDCLLSILMWLMTTVGAVCLVVDILDGTFEWHHAWPMMVLVAESFSYIYTSIKLHKLLVKLKEEEREV